MKSYLAENDMPENVKNSRSKNQIINWFKRQKFGLDLMKKCVELFGSYYNVSWDTIQHEFDEYIYLLHKCRNWNMRSFWSMKYLQIMSRCKGIAVLGRHQLITPWAAAICNGGFSGKKCVQERAKF